LDETWGIIRTAVARDDLQGCGHVICSTARYNPTATGPGPTTAGVIQVHTKEHDIDTIGFRLIELVKQDIKYKTMQCSSEHKLRHTGSERVTMKTIFWNHGKPSFECVGRPCYGTNLRKEDIWHFNVVTAPEPFCSKEAHGRWIMYLENDCLTVLWHHLKCKIENEVKNFGIIRMVCPPKRVWNSPTERPVFHVYTSREDHTLVGRKLIKLTEGNIDYEHNPKYRDAMKTMYWNDGKPDYIAQRNWRKR
jgi:hypothetical protein